MALAEICAEVVKLRVDRAMVDYVVNNPSKVKCLAPDVNGRRNTDFRYLVEFEIIPDDEEYKKLGRVVNRLITDKIAIDAETHPKP